MWDVIVVGAGPAGSYAAHSCARAGLKVQLLEKQILPRDKPCGGATDADILQRLAPGAAALIEARTDRSHVILDMQEVATLDQQNLYFARDRLDHFITRMAVNSGSTLQEGCPVRSVRIMPGGVEVRTDRGVFMGRLVIGADGVNSVVRRSAGMETYRCKPDRYLCGVFEDEVDPAIRQGLFRDGGGHRHYNSYFFNGILGLGWAFPKKGGVNIGMGQILGDSSGLRARLRSLVRGLGLDEKAAQKACWHLVPCRPLRRIYSDRVLLVGDAAGFVNPFTGAGIDLGIDSAHFAATVAAEACLQLDFSGEKLAEYQKMCEPTLRWLRMKARLIKMARFFVENHLDAEIHDRFFLKTLAPLATGS